MKIQNVLQFCIKHDLHLNEFIILYLIDTVDENLLDKYIEKYSFNWRMTGLDTNSLIERGFLIVKKKEGVNKYSVTEKFRRLFSNEDLFLEEIYEEYPGFVTSGTKRLSIKAGDPYHLSKLYVKAIGGSLEEHNEIKQDLKYGIENDLITISITNFINGYYKEIRKLRKGGTGKGIVNDSLT